MLLTTTKHRKVAVANKRRYGHETGLLPLILREGGFSVPNSLIWTLDLRLLCLSTASQLPAPAIQLAVLAFRLLRLFS